MAHDASAASVSSIDQRSGALSKSGDERSVRMMSAARQSMDAKRECCCHDGDHPPHESGPVRGIAHDENHRCGHRERKKTQTPIANRFVAMSHRRLHSAARTLRATLSALVVAVVFPLGAAANTQILDLTTSFVDCGADIDELVVYRMAGIIVIRGTTVDAAKAAEAGRIAAQLGYDRVANLIHVVDGPAADALIASRGQRALDLEPMLEGCQFHVESVAGVVEVRGRVTRDDQKNLAVGILMRVPGVKEVHWD